MSNQLIPQEALTTLKYSIMHTTSNPMYVLDVVQAYNERRLTFEEAEEAVGARELALTTSRIFEIIASLVPTEVAKVVQTEPQEPRDVDSFKAARLVNKIELLSSDPEHVFKLLDEWVAHLITSEELLVQVEAAEKAGGDIAAWINELAIE